MCVALDCPFHESVATEGGEGPARKGDSRPVVLVPETACTATRILDALKHGATVALCAVCPPAWTRSLRLTRSPSSITIADEMRATYKATIKISVRSRNRPWTRTCWFDCLPSPFMFRCRPHAVIFVEQKKQRWLCIVTHQLP